MKKERGNVPRSPVILCPTLTGSNTPTSFFYRDNFRIIAGAELPVKVDKGNFHQWVKNSPADGKFLYHYRRSLEIIAMFFA